MGNLKEMSFKEAWHSEAFQKLRAASLAKDVRGTPCENCVVGG
jgi:MoaA/NifB/PqqE/SkfB family radical SAM enzyme